MNNVLKISIIVPVYNVEKYIIECLLSIENQDFDNSYEVLLIDDCSKDNSILLANHFIANSSKGELFKTIKHSNNKGLSASRNTGIKNARGRYLLFLDSDDTLNKGSLSTLYKQIKSNQLVVGNYKTFGVKTNVSFPELFLNNSSVKPLKDFFLYKYYPMAWNKLISRKFILENNLFFKEGIYHEDILWSYEVATKAKSIGVANFITYNYRIRLNSIMSSKSLKNVEDKLYVLKTIRNKTINDNENKKIYLNKFALTILDDLFSLKIPNSQLKKNKRDIINLFYLEKEAFEFNNFFFLIKTITLFLPTIVIKYMYLIARSLMK
jgi:glycosyltransferase involved in cell wall biosynthesis